MDEQVHIAKGVAWTALGQALADPRLTWVYAERLEDIVLAECEIWLTGPAPLQRWSHGRAFSSTLEVAWWQEGDNVSVRAIGTGTPPAGITWEAQDTSGWGPDPDVAQLLAGQLDTDHPYSQPTWSTARLPRYLAYPVMGEPPPERVALVVRSYRVEGVLVTERLVSLEGV